MVIMYDERMKEATNNYMNTLGMTIQDLRDISHDGEACGLIVASGKLAGVERYDLE